ncbi:hypothetical protein HKX48_006704 [Thoreauomyces humboldtii]|nr:hypothetical protein HKX48_006704 [Thoreauomyces humboldtii]
MSFSVDRVRRENAGNRYQALLQSQLQDDSLFDEDVLDDAEDYVEENEQDEADADFGSTDEDENPLDEEGQVRAEEKAARRKPVAGIVRPMARTVQRRTILTGSGAGASSPVPGPSPIGTQGGRIVKKTTLPSKRRTMHSPLAPAARQSNRSSTVAAKKQLQQKLVANIQRRAMIPQKAKVVEVELTQAEKLAEAVETEKINLASLNTIVQAEEEGRRKSVKQIKKVEGPMITTRSFRVPVNPPPHDGSDRDHPNPEDDTSLSTSYTSRTTLAFVNFSSDPFATLSTPAPIALQPSRCPITGLPAKYRDPSTLIPYATAAAHGVIRRLIRGDYAWSPVCQAYIHPKDVIPPLGVPGQWLQSTLGVKVAEEEKVPKVKKVPKTKALAVTGSDASPMAVDDVTEIAGTAAMTPGEVAMEVQVIVPMGVPGPTIL